MYLGKRDFLVPMYNKCLKVLVKIPLAYEHLFNYFLVRLSGRLSNFCAPYIKVKFILSEVWLHGASRKGLE